ncbi:MULTISPECIES: nuclear transport factor 2 family protein [Streptomyces]|uniref:Hydroxylacyl-CoA dehydrogenase n=1 Tax=Streptomyces tsukubensis (strain DSM 42081 / NBRC 108919 / NRRL 18488 / 9993) TaxID=1114943 RepID=I2NBX1_STRT9|nr:MULTISPECIES: nuclear transport factor 2 family protein [Streptomyces]AZK92488.1 hypothetical protein B7R87_00195 [Streptomyces tsukubensis]EIF94518.1 hydroxylacyl-CoA dehydrogenase [Streptomyces tsukubensis NRRL18488]MYS67106.1 nuclear transport factor 2 family protein [Streptomyces sp. SID5473]QKM65865.1 hydroxylacyl-CoA dehydrogenase [Streptomyces tsukubensis NRRL18488]TAI40896.1 nuclear transport factor 2 family protein [Streptomyces tsukubensis]
MTAEPVGTARRTPRGQGFAALYAQAQQFYAHQMHILNTQATHATERWAGTFTEDAVLELPFLPGPVPARTGLAHYVRAGAERHRRAAGRLDHWVGRLDVRPRADGSLHTRCSALVHGGTPGPGGARVLYVCVMEDVLVATRGGWRTAHRRVTRDDLA